jgi:hypothetical protein
MQTVTLAYRDDDRLPVIFAIREIAKRHYDLDVRVVDSLGSSLGQKA